MFYPIFWPAVHRLSSRFLAIPVLAAGVFLFLLSSCGQSSSAQNLLSPEEFSREMASPGAILLDVRTPGEFAGGHLRGARLADWNDAGFGAAVAGLPRDRTVLVYCLAGGRSAAAAGYLRKEGFARVLELDGGINRWNARGLPTEAGSKTRPAGMSRSDYEGRIREKGLTLVSFSAPWCAPCKKLKPILARLEKEQKGKLQVFIIDADQNAALAREVKADALPTLKLYRDRKEVWTAGGFHDYAELSRVIEANR